MTVFLYETSVRTSSFLKTVAFSLEIETRAVGILSNSNSQFFHISVISLFDNAISFTSDINCHPIETTFCYDILHCSIFNCLQTLVT